MVILLKSRKPKVINVQKNELFYKLLKSNFPFYLLFKMEILNNWIWFVMFIKKKIIIDKRYCNKYILYESILEVYFRWWKKTCLYSFHCRQIGVKDYSCSFQFYTSLEFQYHYDDFQKCHSKIQDLCEWMSAFSYPPLCISI